MAYILYDSKGKEVLKSHMIDVREALETGKYFLTDPTKPKEEAVPDIEKIETEDLSGIVKKTPPPPEPPEEKKKKSDKPIFPGKVVTEARRLTPAK